MEAEIRITKEDLERAVPAAKEAKGYIFNRLKDKIDEAIQDIAVDMLGAVGIAAVNASPHGQLAHTVMDLASVDVFLHEMRGLDLVLTDTGFGIVSTNNTAPASKIRVDALDGELRVKMLDVHERLMKMCFSLDGWYQQGLVIIDTLFCFFSCLKRFAGYQQPLAKDWAEATPKILSADRFLREKISDEFMDELIGKMATNSLSADEKGVVHQIRRTIGVSVIGDQNTFYEYYRRLMNTIEGNLEAFPTYAASDTYLLNHAKPYENRQEDSAFHFVG